MKNLGVEIMRGASYVKGRAREALLIFAAICMLKPSVAFAGPNDITDLTATVDSQVGTTVHLNWSSVPTANHYTVVINDGIQNTFVNNVTLNHYDATNLQSN